MLKYASKTRNIVVITECHEHEHNCLRAESHVPILLSKMHLNMQCVLSWFTIKCLGVVLIAQRSSAVKVVFYIIFAYFLKWRWNSTDKTPLVYDMKMIVSNETYMWSHPDNRFASWQRLRIGWEVGVLVQATGTSCYTVPAVEVATAVQAVAATVDAIRRAISPIPWYRPVRNGLDRSRPERQPQTKP